MKKGKLQFIILMIVVVLNLAACANEQTHQAVYREYLELAKKSYSDAAASYCHYEQRDIMEIEHSATDFVLEYEVIAEEQLRDDLWVFTLESVWNETPNMRYTFVQFVGLVDGEYKVMINADQIPAEQKDGLDLDGYAERFKVESIEATE